MSAKVFVALGKNACPKKEPLSSTHKSLLESSWIPCEHLYVPTICTYQCCNLTSLNPSTPRTHLINRQNSGLRENSIPPPNMNFLCDLCLDYSSCHETAYTLNCTHFLSFYR